MSGTLAFLFATLIGVFITPDGIVVGADTALSNRTGQISSGKKYCVTGPRSVATLQGAYYVRDTETQATVALYDHFQALCAAADNGTPLPTSLRAQARHIANELKSTFEAFLQGVPAAEVVRRYASSSPVVARVAVSGYDERGPASVVIGLGIATDVKTTRWEAQVRTMDRLTFAGCGARFHGQGVVVEALRTGSGARIPPAERQKPETARLAAFLKGNEGNCGAASTDSARQMFADAARLTMALGTGFGIPAGSVNFPLDMVVIPAAGPIRVSHLASP